MNSAGRLPITSAFCLGVWKKMGVRKYKLNHFAASWDATGTNLLGPAISRKTLTLEPNGDKFADTVTIEQYDEVGNSLTHVPDRLLETEHCGYSAPQHFLNC
jgi:hypothetical protein